MNIDKGDDIFTNCFLSIVNVYPPRFLNWRTSQKFFLPHYFKIKIQHTAGPHVGTPPADCMRV